LDNGAGTLTGAAVESCSLARPFRVLFEDGRPLGRINYLFFAPPTGPHFTLGAVVRTPADRFLFFPGLKSRKVNWFARGENIITLTTKPGELLDHFTLEPDLQNWHVTILTEGRKKTKTPRFRARRIGDNLVFWFALSIRSPQNLEPTPKNLEMVFRSTREDSERRTKLLDEARDGAIFNITQLPEGSESVGPGEFMNFEFFLDLNGTSYNGEALAPLQPPAVKMPIEIPRLNPMRAHTVTIPGWSGRVVVSAYTLRGLLADDCVISGG